MDDYKENRTVADTSYSIIDSEIIGNTEIVLGENINGHFATWTRNVEVDKNKGGENWHTGNYFMEDKESAIQNFQDRVNDAKPRDIITLDDIKNNPKIVVSILEENADIRDKLNRLSEMANFNENLDVKLPFEQLQQVSNICLDAYFHSDNSVSMNNILDFVAEGFNEGVVNLDNLAQMNKYELVDFVVNENLDGVSEQYPIEDLSHLQEYEIDAINQIKSGVSLGELDSNLSSNWNVVMVAVENNGDDLKFAHFKLQADFDIVKTAVENTGSALNYADEDLLDDIDFMKSAFEIDTDTFEYASDEVKNEIANDSKFLLETIEGQHSAIVYASDELKNDRDFLKDAITVNPQCFKSIVNDSYITKGANHKNPIDNDRELVELAVKGSGLMLSVASNELKNDKDLVLTAISKYPFALRDASTELKGDPEVVLCAIEKSNDTLLLDFASQDLQSKFKGKDKDEVIAGLKQLVSVQKQKERPSVKEKINANKEIIAQKPDKKTDKNIDKNPR